MDSHLVLDHDDLNISNLSLQNDALSKIRKESLDLYNRLQSIEEDIQFVNQVHAVYSNLPLIPNLRCGAWYCDPAISAPYPAYFKSTDGHTSSWKFNLRRPNLHLLPVIQRSEGIVLVDSTRAGKRIPDALSKTIPIWCAVINRATVLRYPEVAAGWDTALHTPPLSVSKQEHAQIEKLLDGWADALFNSSYDLPKLSKPVRPIWVTPASSSFPQFDHVDFYPIICVSASRQVDYGLDRRTGGFVYVQGSGDDHELWGQGLTPQNFWSHHDTLLSATQADIDKTVASVNEICRQTSRHITPPTKISTAGNRIWLSSLDDVSSTSHDAEELVAFVLIASDRKRWPDMSEDEHVSEEGLSLRMVSPEGKKGQMHFLQVVLPRSLKFIRTQLSGGASVCVACPTGNDTAVGVGVAALQQFFNAHGQFVLDNKETPDKQTIRTRLEWIISVRPTANPSRNTLKRVNEFLLSSTAFRASSVKTR